MRQTMRRIPIAIGLAGITVALIWVGYQVFDAGRDVMAQEARLRVEYFFGSHLFWLLAGVMVAAIPEVDSEPTARRPITPTLMAAIVPIMMLLPIYIWTNPNTPRWLRQIAVQEWLLRSETQVAAGILGGVLIGTALWRRVLPIGMRKGSFESDSQ